MKGIKQQSFVIITASIFIVFLGIMIFNTLEIQNSMKKVNGNIHINTIEVNFNDVKLKELIKIVEKMKNKGISIRNYSPDNFVYRSNNVTGLYSDKITNPGLELESGRFFTEKDLESEKPVAVVGSEVLEHCKKKDGKYFLIRANKEFEVIGVVRDKENIKLNEDIILYNLKAILNEGEKFPVYDIAWYLDSDKLNKHELIALAEEIGGESILIKEPTIRFSPVQDSILLNLENNKSLLIMLFCIFISFIRAIMYWIESIKLEIGVRRACGATKKDITILILNDYIYMISISVIVSFMIQFLLIKTNILSLIKYNFSLNIFAISIFIIAIVMVLTVPLILKNISKISIGKVLKAEE